MTLFMTKPWDDEWFALDKRQTTDSKSTSCFTVIGCCLHEAFVAVRWSLVCWLPHFYCPGWLTIRLCQHVLTTSSNFPWGRFLRSCRPIRVTVELDVLLQPNDCWCSVLQAVDACSLFIPAMAIDLPLLWFHFLLLGDVLHTWYHKSLATSFTCGLWDLLWKSFTSLQRSSLIDHFRVKSEWFPQNQKV